MATYTIFAGVNGAGKTSIYKSIYYERNKSEERINTDEMVARIGSWKDILDVCNEINIYDNTNKFKHVAYICNGILRWKRDIIPKWGSHILK
ncbi:hypothetical protein [Clostridium kluyveri]|uniref:Uncharacterized protein n=1 Tax=Clostridium kluyveri TaxID=1534 RepID=A0A1L5FA17_CLOKL|nr:hypothetical protein [Clostridium kluyveri]APM39855.1 hypothetical protein BS101_14505 [Clostridium kluyveri]